MALDLLKRKLAPVLPAAFAAIDAEASRVLKLNLAGRRLVDFRGPHGWELAAVNTGRMTMISDEPALKVWRLMSVSGPLKSRCSCQSGSRILTA